MVVTLLLTGAGCQPDRPDVGAAAAGEAAESDQVLDRVIGEVADRGVTAEAARILAAAGVRRAPVLAARAKAEPDTVREFVAALTDADPTTLGPLTAAVVAGLGLALHESLIGYSRLDLDVKGVGGVLLGLERGSSGLKPLADAVREAAEDEDAVWAALLAALAAAGPPERGAVFSGADDASLLALGAGAAAGSEEAPDRPRDLVRQIQPSLQKVLASLFSADPAIRAALAPALAPDDQDLVAQADVAFALDILTRADGLRSTPAATLARLVLVPVVP